jgi:hypothetical protein
VKFAHAVKAAKYMAGDAARAAKFVRIDHAKKFAQHVVPEVVRPARVIWNQAVGAIFLVLAVPALTKAFQAYRDLGVDPKSGFTLGLSLTFAAVMLLFGIGSFAKARRISAAPTIRR